MVDGVAFGRPRLRATRDRPPITLPPRKRARIEYTSDSEDDDDNEPEHTERLARLPSSRPSIYPSTYATDPGSIEDDEDFDGNDKDYASDSTTIRRNIHGDQDEDSEYDASQDEEENLEEEIRVLQEESRLAGDNEDDVPDSATRSGQAATGDFVSSFDRAMKAPVTAFKQAFPRLSEGVIRGSLISHAQNLRSTYGALGEMELAELSFDQVTDLCLHLMEEDQGLSSLQITEPLQSLAQEQKRPLIQEVEDTAFPFSSQRQSRNKSPDDVDAEPTHEEATSFDDSSSSDDSSDSDQNELRGGANVARSSDDSDSDSDSSGPTSSSAASDSEVDKPSATIEKRTRTRTQTQKVQSSGSSDNDSSDSLTSSTDETSSSEDDSSSSSDEDSDSDSAPQELSAKQITAPHKQATAKTTTKPVLPTASSKSPVPELPSGVVEQVNGVPRHGLSKTQKRNRRRKDLKQRKALEEELSKSTQPSTSATDDVDFLARKQALLNAVTASDMPQQSDSSPMALDLSVEQNANNLVREIEAVSHDKQPESQIAPRSTEVEGTATPDIQAGATSQEDTPHRRLRMDLGAGKRLLFGALGLKAPKTKADEEKLKQDLMKDVRPLKNHRQSDPWAEAANESQHLQPNSVEAVSKDSDDTTWKAKIKYRAVECCQEGIELSEPPFPFVQRWDPQQRGGRKRKRNSQNYSEEDYYDNSYQDDSAFYEGNEDWADDSQTQNATKKTKNRKGQGAKGKAAKRIDDTANLELNYDDPPTASRGDSSQFTDVDDLPSLPSDVTTLPILQIAQIKPGMVITWKQLLMSKATNWQPELSSATGLVVSLENDNSLQVVLAKRDREQEEKEYDDETGQRVYDKFEMPSDSENEADSDDGRRELSWAEIIEPRLVQAEPLISASNSPARAAKRDTKIAGDDGKNKEKQGDSEQCESPAESLSIPSGQRGRLLEFPAPSIDITMNNEVSQEKISQTQSAEAQPSPSSSPQGGSPPVRVFPPSSAHEQTPEAVRDDVPANTHNQGGLSEMSDGTGSASASASAYQDAVPSLSTAGVQDSQLTPTGKNNGNHMTNPSSANTEIGCRQSKTNSINKSSMNEDEFIPETNVSSHGALPESGDALSAADASSRGSSPPFPSIDEIWHTASSSRQTQSPLKSSQTSALQKVKVKSDADYEAAMQRLDEGDDGEESDSLPNTKNNNSIRNLFPNATQPSLLADTATLPAPKRSRPGPLSPFKVPDGSQVIALSSSIPGSPNSPTFTEKYAEESVDESYKGAEGAEGAEDDSSSLPHGSGWVTKKKRSNKVKKTHVAAPASRLSRRAKTPALSASAVFAKRKKSGKKN